MKYITNRNIIFGVGIVLLVIGIIIVLWLRMTVDPGLIKRCDSLIGRLGQSIGPSIADNCIQIKTNFAFGLYMGIGFGIGGVALAVVGLLIKRPSVKREVGPKGK